MEFNEALPPPPLVDLESSPIPGQIGSAVLDLKGRIVEGGGQISTENASVLFEMLVEVGMLQEKDFQRMTVAFPSMRYVVARDQNYVYIVQARNT